MSSRWNSPSGEDQPGDGRWRHGHLWDINDIVMMADTMEATTAI